MQNIPLIDIAMGFSSAMDMISPQMANHQKRVAYMAYAIAAEMGIGEKSRTDILLAGLLHDCGAIHDDEKLKNLQYDLGTEAQERQEHCIRGWKLLRDSEDLKAAAEIIRFHHTYWNERASIPTEGYVLHQESHILHLADRIDVLVDRGAEILEQRPAIVKRIGEGSGSMFMPEAVEAFIRASGRDYFWFDLISPFMDDLLRKFAGNGLITVGSDKLLSLAGIVNRIIDFRSSFTAAHSVGVAECARIISHKAGFSREEVQMMTIAGLLHDLGKLAIPVEILEKKGPLNLYEYNIIKRHAFYTHRIIEKIPHMETINQWASFHHERMDGSGYPFGLGRRELPAGSRIMAVSDVFTALTEPRPYRNALPAGEALAIMDRMVKDMHLDGEMLSLLKRNMDEINPVKLEAQGRELKRHSEFHLPAFGSCPA